MYSPFPGEIFGLERFVCESVQHPDTVFPASRLQLGRRKVRRMVLYKKQHIILYKTYNNIKINNKACFHISGGSHIEYLYCTVLTKLRSSSNILEIVAFGSSYYENRKILHVINT